MKYKTGEIMAEEKPPDKGQYCCFHKNMVPLEMCFANKTHPNGYSKEPYYNFAVSNIGANRIIVKTYFCLDCKQEIKAPNPGTLKKDRL